MLAKVKSKQMEVGETEVERSRGIRLITDIGANSDVLNVDQESVWAQVHCPVDSGACANVASKEYSSSRPLHKNNICQKSSVRMDRR